MLGPRSMDSAQHLQRHRSTKLLIDRYESMSKGPAVHPSHSSARGVASSSGLMPKQTLLSQGSNKKDRSPIRQSIRNLFSVFKKVNVTGRFKSDENTSLVNRPEQASHIESPSVFDFKPLPPVKKQTGPLLYLARTSHLSSSLPILPVWTICTANIESNMIVISWSTTRGNPSIHNIRLSNCTDVRSLSSQQLDAEERALLPKGDTNELKVFEILFEGKAREKFAATSVRERAEWVSAIWDAILPSHEPKRRDQEFTGESLDTSSPSESATTSAISPPRPSTSNYTERSLPSTPVSSPPNISARQAQLMPPPISPSIYAPTRPTSRASSPSHSRCNSPSIANLDRLSVVKQRLAQIERTSSQSSSFSGLTSPMWSPQTPGHSPLTTPSIDLRERSNSPNPKLQRLSSVRSNTMDHILSSYGDVVTDISDTNPPSLHLRECKVDFQFLRVPSDTGLQPAAMTSGSEVLRDHSYYIPRNTALSLQNDIQDLAQELVFPIDCKADPASISKTISKLDEMTEVNGEIIRMIEKRTIAAEERQRKCIISNSSNASNLLQAVQSIHQQLATDFPAVMTTLNEIQEGQATRRDAQAISIFDTGVTQQQTFAPIDLSGLHVKLDDLLAGCSTGITSDPSPEVKQVLPLLQEVKTQVSLQAQQQADSLRYLNELNTWLEAFVNNGTSHIHELVSSVDQLSKDLGCGSQQGASNLSDLRQLVLAMQTRDQNIMALQASVDSLTVKLNGDTGTASTVEMIADMIDRQRQDQERLFRGLTNEISDEIKGERLRFVEAMKEATAINVQIHVEQFKEELTREVLGMTHEVGRLHRERQTVQNQIADLFAFYTKQKQAGESLNVAQVPSQRPFERSSPHRPLPHPRPI